MEPELGHVLAGRFWRAPTEDCVPAGGQRDRREFTFDVDVTVNHGEKAVVQVETERPSSQCKAHVNTPRKLLPLHAWRRPSGARSMSPNVHRDRRRPCFGPPASLSLAALALCAASTLANADTVAADASRRDVDLVIALDVSGSMEGLIESAKQRLWDITNELAQARPVPAAARRDLELRRVRAMANNRAIVRVDLPFTPDLDAVNATLFAFQTDGGDEYVARAIQTSLDKLQWSQRPDALQIVFVAGNESAEQDPQLTIEQADRLRPRAAASSSTRSTAAPTTTPTRAAGDESRPTRTAYTRASIRMRPRSRTSRRRSTRGSPHSTTSSTPPTSRSAPPASAARANQVAQDSNAAAMSPAAAASRTVAEGRRALSFRVGSRRRRAVRQSARGHSRRRAAGRDAGDRARRARSLRARASRAPRRTCSAKSASSPPSAAGTSRSRTARATALRSGLDAAILEGIREVAATKGFSFASK